MSLPTERPLDDEGVDGWRVCKVRCRICGHRWVSVFPVEADEDRLECSACGCDSSEVTADVLTDETVEER